MILKRRILRLTVHYLRAYHRINAWFDKAALACGRTSQKVTRVNWRRWCKLLAKITAVFTTVTGAVTALTSSSSATGIALGAAGATSGVVAHGIPVKGYEKIKHISPKMQGRGLAMPMGRQVGAPKGSAATAGMAMRTRFAKPTTSKRT